MRYAARAALAILFFAAATSATAEETNLLSIGSFNTVAPNAIGGVDTYVVNCDQRNLICEDNIGNTWVFGDLGLEDYYIRMCEQLVNVVQFNCVHYVEINLALAGPYSNTTVEIQRRGCGIEEYFLNGDELGSVRGDNNGIGILMNIRYQAGLLTPRKTNTIAITAPDVDLSKCAGGNQRDIISGFAIKGESLSGR